MTAPRFMTCDSATDLAGGYVLGALERVEETDVQHHLATCDRAHAEFEMLGGVVPALLELEDIEMVEPPTGLRDRIMAAAAADLAARQRTSAPVGATVPATAPAGPIPFPSAAARESRRSRPMTSRFDWGLRIAAVIAIVAVGGWGLGLQRQLDAAQRFDGAVAAVVQAAGQPGATTVILTAAQGSRGSGIAAVAPSGSVVLAMRDLPATSGSQVYETWVIIDGQDPLAVGGFTVDSNGTAGFTTRSATTPPGATIALTLEPQAGNTAPMGPIVSSGIAATPPGATG